MEGRGRVELEIFVQPSCDPCERARRLAAEMDGAFPRLAVRVIDVADGLPQRDDVFAVPTFVLNGRVFSLGNPRRSDLHREIEFLLNDRHSV